MHDAKGSMLFVLCNVSFCLQITKHGDTMLLGNLNT